MSKTLLLTEFFPPHYGGVERSCQLIAERLGKDVTVVAPRMEGSEDFDATQMYAIIRRSLFSGRGKPSWLWLVPWLRQQHRLGAELVIFCHYSSAVSAGWLVKGLGLPYAVLVHGNDVLTEAQRLTQKKFIGRNLRDAAWVGVNSSFTADHVRQYGVAESRIIRTHPAVGDEPWHNTLTAASDGKVHIVTVCRLVPRKNVGRVIEAAATLRQEFPNLVYDIVGDGPERHELEQKSRALNLGSAVVFHGSVPDDKKWQLMKQATVAIMVPEVRAEGTDVEGLGLFYLETAAMGLPIVATDTGGISDAVKHELNGLIVDPTSVADITDVVGRLLRVPEYRRRLGNAGPAMMKQEFTAQVRIGRVASVVQREKQPQPPLVSIVIPAYQSAQTMRSTLESVLSQTWANREIIVVDDGSTDNLKTVVQPFEDKIKLIQQSNQGAPAARNRGAAEAKGEFIIFVDADIVLQPEAITDMVVTLQTHPEATYAYSDFKFGPKNFHLFEFSGEKLRQQNYIHTTSFMRRVDFSGFDPTLKRFQDWDLWLTMLQKGQQGIWIPKKLFAVKERADGMSKWVPSFVYKLPLIGRGWGSENIASYREAETVIKQKHKLA